jgi:hypothetical protein
MKEIEESDTAPTNPFGSAGAARRAHAINNINLELNAAGDIRSHDDGKWASVFAIHNKYRGREKPSKAVPIFVKFGGNTAAYAIAAIKKGTHFTVGGTLDFDKGDESKDFYRINADQLSVHSPKTVPATASAA